MNRPEAVRVPAQRVDARLQVLFDEEHDRWAAVDPDLAGPFIALRDYAMAGGKRLRPAFCYWSFVGAGGDPEDPGVIDAGAGIEMLHTAALLHDDIIDRSERRHGADTLHVRYARLHRDRDWSGRADRFGEGVAILIGDLALVYSSRLLAGAPAVAGTVFEEMRLEVNVGQYLDILSSAQGLSGPADRAESRARRIYRYKTAKYSIERPLHLGAALAGPERFAELAEPLSDFGLPLGEAFQLKDDLLGVFGDPALTGKPVGDDLRQGKTTLLASLAAQRDPSFVDAFGAPDLGDSGVAALQEIIEATGARGDVEAMMAELVAQAEAALGALPLAEEARARLGQLALYVEGRDR